MKKGSTALHLSHADSHWSERPQGTVQVPTLCCWKQDHRIFVSIVEWTRRATGGLMWTVLMKRAYRLIIVPPFAYGHELRVETERMWSMIQEAKMTVLSFRDRLRTSVILEDLGVELLLLQLRWLWLGCPPWPVLVGVFCECPTRRGADPGQGEWGDSPRREV